MRGLRAGKKWRNRNKHVAKHKAAAHRAAMRYTTAAEIVQSWASGKGEHNFDFIVGDLCTEQMMSHWHMDAVSLAVTAK